MKELASLWMLKFSKAPWSKSFMVFTQRNHHLGVIGGAQVGLAAGLIVSNVSGWWIALTFVGFVLCLILVMFFQAYLSLSWSRLDWWYGWRANHDGKNFLTDNPYDWETHAPDDFL